MNKKHKNKYKKPKSWVGLVNFIEYDLYLHYYDVNKNVRDILFVDWFNIELFITENDFIDNIYPSAMTVKLCQDWSLSSFEIINFSNRNLFSIFNGCKKWEVIPIIFRAYYRNRIGTKSIENYIQDILNEKLIKNIIE